jgi:hypothetical protein
MQTRLHTTHFILLHQLIQISNNVKPFFLIFLRRTVFCLILLLSFQLQAEALKIAVIDTGFCPYQLEAEIKNLNLPIKVERPKDLTKGLEESVQQKLIFCRENFGKLDLELNRYHGQKVVSELLSHIKVKRDITIIPLIVFDYKGQQTKEAWLKALKVLGDKKVDIVLAASSFLNPDADFKDHLLGEALWFVASGQINPFVPKKSSLFPQILAPKDKLILVGDYFDESFIIFNQSLMYPDVTDFFFSNKGSRFKGSSRSVAIALARALEICPQIQQMKSCLVSKQKKLTDEILKKDFFTF